MHNSNCSNLFLQQETIHVDGILSACERGITWYSMKMSNFVIWYEGKGLFPSSRELRHWNDLRVWKISVFSLWKQSHLIFHLPTLPLSPGKRIFLLLAWQKNSLGLLLPGSNDKYRSKSFLFHKNHGKGSELPRIQDSRRESFALENVLRWSDSL